MSDWVGIFIILISLFCGGFALGVKWGEPMLDSLKALLSADVQPHQLTEEDLTELRHRFGNKVERVVRDMISGKEERWMT